MVFPSGVSRTAHWASKRSMVNRAMVFHLLYFYND
jgi:hypothetical protein